MEAVVAAVVGMSDDRCEERSTNTDARPRLPTIPIDVLLSFRPLALL